jgi:NAD(P)-dependent dehydrogenase (short-subunit alcohol dehydrogenase family)
MMSGKLTDRVAIVTGAASGISRATALLFAKQGAVTVIADIDERGGTEAVAQVRDLGGEAEFREVDATDAAQVKALMDETLANHGALDILVNGAAYQTETGPVTDVTEEEWDAGLDLFLKAPFLGCKYAIPAMLKGGGGAIINISSAVVLRGSTFSLPYSIAKAGIVQLTKTASSQFCRQGIRVNCILPGVVDTPGSRRVSNSPSIAAKYADGIPVGRMGQPEDIARLALYLASDDAEYVAGASFLIDGGINNL